MNYPRQPRTTRHDYRGRPEICVNTPQTKKKITIRIRAETYEVLGASATKLGKKIPSLVADLAEAMTEVKPERFHEAVAAMTRAGR